MKIGFIGAGNMATALGKYWLPNGHKLFFSHSRDLNKLRAQAASVDPKARIGTAEEAATFADVLVLTTPYDAGAAAIQAAGKLDGKILWSIANPFKPDFSGLQLGTTTSGAEELAKLALGARFVAAIPPFAEGLHSGKFPSPPPSVFVCGDDDASRQTVMKLVEELDIDAVDAGPLFAARFFEPTMMGLIYLAYARKLGSGIGLHFSR